MTRNYYFLSSSLPELQIGLPPELPFVELEPLLITNLSSHDYAKVRVIRRFYDLQNLRAHWKGDEHSPYGNFNVNELQEAVLTRFGLPEYVYDFLDRHEDTAERLAHFPALLAAYYREEIPKAAGFLKRYLQFEREWRLVAAGFRAKELGRDLAVELQYEDAADDLVAQMLAQRDAKTIDPPDQYEDLKAIFDSKHNDPLELHKALAEYQFDRISQFSQGDVFSINRILAYLTQLILVEQWMELDKAKGLQIIDTIIKVES